MDNLLIAEKRTCAGCAYLDSFKPRPDEQRRYGFGEIGYGCKEPGFEGYVQPDHPICVRGPFRKASQLSRRGDAE
jgi:hypothetical protein